MSFEEYVALARQLAEHRRAGERDAAAESERRRGLHAAADYLHQRLTAQGHRLDQLGRAIGVDKPPPGPTAAPGDDMPGARPGVPPGGSGSPVPTGSAGDSAAWPGPPTGSGSAAAPGSGDGRSAGAAGVPGRAGVGAYPELPAVQAPLALPTAVSPAGVGVPAQRAAAVDPVVELELARRMADEADRHGQQAELLAQRPALLPTWSPLARAVAVYASCGAAAGVLMLILVVASGVGMVDGFTLGAWICAGLPALAFFGGYLVLGRWGRPAMVAGTPPRYLPLGFLICFLVVPLGYCAYLLLFRALR
ncbi:hypothetical protein OOJ91_10525 [Micromonospora lupini]|uniref:hypothetical protein n=1 Tax=Micromonospora lupini TaxID=285679 RepID=UPI00224F0B00|nr:hypothetical protein [Micromonospora lupini]MCX5066311.1 hypothetical protein [Micromonospora lupini]